MGCGSGWDWRVYGVGGVVVKVDGCRCCSEDMIEGCREIDEGWR